MPTLLNQYGQPLNTGRYVSAPSRDAGAYRGTIANWHPSRLVNRDAEIRERLTIQRRAADLAANDWAAKSGLRTIADNAVGTGLGPQSRTSCSVFPAKKPPPSGKRWNGPFPPGHGRPTRGASSILKTCNSWASAPSCVWGKCCTCP